MCITDINYIPNFVLVFPSAIFGPSMYVQEGRETPQHGRCSACYFPKLSGNGCPVVIDIGGVRHGVSELLQAAYTKPLDICCGFDSTLNLYFGFSVLGKIIPVRW